MADEELPLVSHEAMMLYITDQGVTPSARRTPESSAAMTAWYALDDADREPYLERARNGEWATITSEGG